MKKIFALAGIVLLLGTSLALAQAAAETLVVETAPPPVFTWLQPIKDIAYTIIAILVPIMGTFLFTTVQKYLGAGIAARIQQSFQDAALRAAAKALDQAGANEATKVAGVQNSSSTVSVGVEYLRKMMPDTIKREGLDDKSLINAVEANIAKIKLGVGVAPVEPVKLDAFRNR